MFKKILYSPEFNIAVFAFLLNFVWELFQLPLFIGFDNTHYYDAIIHCTIATLGDVLISLFAFTIACTVTRSRTWFLIPNKFSFSVFILTGVLITVGFEILATNYMDRWQYSNLMPIVPIINIGVSPLAQWLILPVIQIWYVKNNVKSYYNGYSSKKLGVVI